MVAPMLIINQGSLGKELMNGFSETAGKHDLANKLLTLKCDRERMDDRHRDPLVRVAGTSQRPVISQPRLRISSQRNRTGSDTDEVQVVKLSPTK